MRIKIFKYYTVAVICSQIESKEAKKMMRNITNNKFLKKWR